MSINRIKKIREALSELEVCSYHYTASVDAGNKFIVWSELSEDEALIAGNHKAENVYTGFVDYFTDEEYDEMVDEIEKALNGTEGCIAIIDSIQFGDPSLSDDNLIHYTWRWRLL